ncbi:hypothetical protein A5707_16265 [Mycobacterium kyorinense]|uniref:DUF1028 domain-containing protein n=1 Tax=Mycobacterium kyorinense TaxID=487514 RepID=A0A1A2ZL11_9MYCO|nr:DUF1028 domain-containing protein [Mycobacterium kyorinense]OBI49771.1 hypothetical protein A5707_16265 [Mycobacterium kyorinense]
MTFSLLARDPATGALGVASQSHYLGVGAVVTWAEAGVGVVATQAFPERSYGPQGLALMRDGQSAREALSLLVDADPDRELRQVGYLGPGGFGLHSGERCVAAAGVAVTDHAAALGNMLDSDDVLGAMLRGFEGADGDLAHRLLAGLRGGEEAGGDIRGSQSAALLVVDGQRTDSPWDGVLRDVRVDDHPDPIGELSRLIKLADAYDEVSRVVFNPLGVVLGGHDTEFAAAAVALAAADDVLGPNPEATFWSAVLHARWGQRAEARRLLADAAQRNPRLPRFVTRLADAGILTADEAEVLS